jgi:hypothetical protein
MSKTPKARLHVSVLIVKAFINVELQDLRSVRELRSAVRMANSQLCVIELTIYQYRSSSQLRALRL